MTASYASYGPKNVNMTQARAVARRKLKRLVRKNIPNLITIASLATTAGVVYYYHNKTFIELTPAMIEQLKAGGRWVFPVHGESVLVTLSPV